MNRDPLAAVLAEHGTTVTREVVHCACGHYWLRGVVEDERRTEHLAAVVRAFLTSDETVERVAFAIFAEHEPAFAHQEKRTRLWHALLDQFRACARAALAAATEARP